MIQIHPGWNKIPASYAMKIETIADMKGCVVEIVDKFNFINYTLSNIYLNKNKAIKEGVIFVNTLLEEEKTLTIN